MLLLLLLLPSFWKNYVLFFRTKSWGSPSCLPPAGDVDFFFMLDTLDSACSCVKVIRIFREINVPVVCDFSTPSPCMHQSSLLQFIHLENDDKGLFIVL